MIAIFAYVKPSEACDMCMETNYEFLPGIESDLGLNVPYLKGQPPTSIRRCWHFSTDGTNVESMFYDNEDFISGMNRNFKLSLKYRVLILAFALMDTHIHYILYGEYDECNRFIHEYVRLTSYEISLRHSDRQRLRDIMINHRAIDTDVYLKTSIAYVLRNPVAAGLGFTFYDYPWSSGSLYFRQACLWTSPCWYWIKPKDIGTMGQIKYRKLFSTHDKIACNDIKVADGLIFPGEYVAVELVERIFKTPKSFNYFMGQNKDIEIEAEGGAISRLSIPIYELRQNRDEECQRLFGVSGIRMLNTQQRVKLARVLKFKYNCSNKQILRVCGLSANDAGNLI